MTDKPTPAPTAREPGWYWARMHGDWRPVKWAPLSEDDGACGWWSDDGGVYADEWWAEAVTAVGPRIPAPAERPAPAHELAAKYPQYAKGRSLITDAFRDARAALRAAAGSEGGGNG